MNLADGEERHWDIALPLYSEPFDRVVARWHALSPETREDPQVRVLFCVCFIRHGEIALACETGGAMLDRSTRPLGTNIARLLSQVVAFLRTWRFERTLRILLAFIVLWTRRSSREALFLRMYASMWTDHALGLCYSLPLFARAYLEGATDAPRCMWFHAFVSSLNGLFDSGVDLAKVAQARWEAQHPLPFHKYWLHEALAVRASVEFYAGFSQEALATHAAMDAIFESPEAFAFNSIYSNALRMRAALAICDTAAFQSSVEVLRKLLADKYDMRFALRAHSFSAVLHALAGRREDSVRELGLADAMCGRTASDLENYYHHLQKSRVYLQEGFVGLAVEAARFGRKGIARTAPCGPHFVEACFTMVCCLIVAHATQTFREELGEELRANLHTLRRAVWGSRVWKERHAALVQLAACLDHGDASELCNLLKQPADVLGLSDELLRALNFPRVRLQEGERYATALQAAAESLQSTARLTLYLRQLDELVRRGGEADDVLEAARAFAEERLRTPVLLRAAAPLPPDATEVALGVHVRKSEDARRELFVSFGDHVSRRLFVENYGETLGFRRDVLEETLLWRQITDSKLIELVRTRELARQQRNEAVALTTAMLAHDVRRPFRMLRAAIDLLERASEPNEFRRRAEIVLPEIKLATETADGLIADVLGISTGLAAARPEPIAPAALIARSLTETLRGYPTADVSFTYDLRHHGAMNVEPKKVQRVFSNIIANAIQAMDHRGRISFATSRVVENGAAFVSFVVANDGPVIPECDVASLFEPFFTRNKPTGTGLGLAIAHRVVTAHGGRIECIATGGRGAAFRVTLPWVATETAPPPPLPSHSSELASLDARAPESSRAPVTPPGTRVPPEVAIVDDSRAFLMSWQTALAGSAGAYFFTSPEAFWRAIDDEPGLLARLSVVVTDYRFGNSRQTGVSFARAVKGRRSDLPVFLSSSGYVSRREIAGAIDVELDKDTVSWPALSAALEETSNRTQGRV